MKFILSVLLPMLSVWAQAQQTASVGYFITDLKGEPLVNKYERVTEGSPFFNEDWLKGKVVTADGKLYDNMSLRINLLENEIHFLNEKQQEMKMTEAIRTVYLADLQAGKTYTFTRPSINCGLSPKTWYQVLDSGHVSLLKAQVRTLTEIKPYNSASTQGKIITTIRYIALDNRTCQSVKTPQELYDFLHGIKPGFAEKPAGRSSAKKMEEDLIVLLQQFQPH